MSCAGWTRLIDRRFVSGLGPWRWRRLRAHLGECDTCRAYYDKVALVWRAMGPGATPPLHAETMADDVLRRSGGGTVGTRWLLAAVSAVAAAAVLLLVLRNPTRPVDHGTWIERGGAVDRTGRARGVRAFCLGNLAPTVGERDASVVVRGSLPSVRAAEAPALGSLRCRLEDSLQFAYTLGAGDAEHLVLVGRDGAGEAHWYAPDDAGGAALPLHPGALDEPLPSSIRLRVRHHAGPLRVDALFATRAVPVAEVQAALVAGRDLASLPGVVDHQSLVLTLDN